MDQKMKDLLERFNALPPEKQDIVLQQVQKYLDDQNNPNPRTTASRIIPCMVYAVLFAAIVVSVICAITLMH